jgi:hypothetical protein
MRRYLTYTEQRRHHHRRRCTRMHAKDRIAVADRVLVFQTAIGRRFCAIEKVAYERTPRPHSRARKR